ncbi:Gfo/Idh/MocA family protein [Dyadobacter sediminis]|uniref:Gfo/Idh/MocA family oxidoreductase n=1 Tax=Dyadobacter sediminis TaxID=1493691 RepID=A0A5R9KKE3_9BACT|nr:Gfo/Idh/MocA family oxidoreductase [Dyadobacter sediminis]TLU96683.1 Gfo/Idh/MocA family oxidoreductase [Dyadobacter sediminis]
MDRRHFIQKATLAGSAAGIFPSFIYKENKPLDKVRMGFIGVGLRGRSHVEQALYRPDIEINAICDIDPAAVDITLDKIKKAGKKAPAVYSKGDEDFLNLVKRDDLDGILIATPWHWHVPMAVAVMNAGKYAAVEVSATVTLQESWDLVNTYEKTGSHCMILENVCYRRDVMAILKMVREGMFGEMTYAHCGYQHDLRSVKFNNGKSDGGVGAEFGEKGFSEAKWRTQHSVDRNGDIYPTHGLGPVAHWLDINRGNCFTHLTSTSTKSRGLHKYVVDHGGKDHPNAKVNFKLGDIVTTVIQCHNGENIVLIHDTNSPRPYSLGFRAQGTNGIWMNDGNSIYLEGISPKEHTAEPDKAYLEKNDHPLWKKHAREAENAGHGGIDYFVLRGFVEAIKNKTAPPIDVYDAAVWSAISPLSEMSIARGSAPVEIPDFTRGKWKTNPRIFGLNDAF